MAKSRDRHLKLAATRPHPFAVSRALFGLSQGSAQGTARPRPTRQPRSTAIITYPAPPSQHSPQPQVSPNCIVSVTTTNPLRTQHTAQQRAPPHHRTMAPTPITSPSLLKKKKKQKKKSCMPQGHVKGRLRSPRTPPESIRTLSYSYRR